MPTVFVLPLMLTVSARAADPPGEPHRYQLLTGDGQHVPEYQAVRDRDGEREEHEEREHHREGRAWDYDFRYPDHWPGGYRGEPYGRRRYGHPHHYGDRDYRYAGHWRSWKEWNEYRRRHLQTFHRGRYYHQDGHLFFRFCDPDGDTCAFFSIGR